MAEGAFWARRNKPIWPASADPVGQPVPGPNQPPKFLNRFSILPLDFQDNPLKYLAESIAIGRQWLILMTIHLPLFAFSLVKFINHFRPTIMSAAQNKL